MGISATRVRSRLCRLAGVLLAAAAGQLAAAADDDARLFDKVCEILDNSCIGCHGADKQKGKLRLDSRAAWLAGGRDGTIVVPGDPAASLVVSCIAYEAKKEDQNMPPKRKQRLSAEQVALVSAWITQGLPWPAPAAAPKKK